MFYFVVENNGITSCWSFLVWYTSYDVYQTKKLQQLVIPLFSTTK